MRTEKCQQDWGGSPNKLAARIAPLLENYLLFRSADYHIDLGQ